MRWQVALGCLIGLMEVFFSPPQAGAQRFALGNLEGELETTVNFSRQDTKTQGAESATFQNLNTEEKFTLRSLGGYIYDPRLVTFSLGGTFGLSQQRFTTENESASDNGTLWGYNAFASIFPGSSYSLNLFANRNQSILSRELAGRTEIVTENRGATLFAQRLLIPSSLSFRQELQSSDSRAATTVTRRDEERNILTYVGERGWVDSEMNLRYEFIDFSDKIFPGLDYQSHEGSLYYSLDFGPELNRRWDSRVRYFTRTGATDLTNITADEFLVIDHTDRLRTDYRYALTHVESQGSASTTHQGLFNLRHRLYLSLTSTLGADVVIQKLPGGERNTYGGRLDFAYTKRLPGEGRLNAGLGGRFQYEDSKFRTTESSVLQESHTFATPFALPVTLNNPFVVESSVTITKTGLGPDSLACGQTLPLPTLMPGTDYNRILVGDTTQIEPLPSGPLCSKIGINPGDTIAVDYSFTVSPSLALTTTTWHFDLSVDYRWIRPFFIHEQSNQSLVSGRDGQFLDDIRSDTVGTEFRYDGTRARGRLLAEARWYDSRRLAYNSFRSTESGIFFISPELTLNLNADQSLFDFSVPNRQSRTFNNRATLTYTPGPNLFVDAYAGIRWLLDSDVPTERVTEAGVRARWFFRKIEIIPSLQFFDRNRGDTDSKEYRAMLRIVRRFSYP